MVYSSPHHLIETILEKWNDVGSGFNATAVALDDEFKSLDFDIIQNLVSTCYQTSIMTEEKRALQFRLILLDPEKLSAEEGPPDGLHRLIFSEPRPFNEYELRRLAPAVDFYGSLIGVKTNSEGKLQIWGIIHSGPRWMQAIKGGSLGYLPLPQALVLYVVRAGHIVICKGSEMIAILNGGKILTPSKSVLNSGWFREGLAAAAQDLWTLHDAARSEAQEPWAFLERNFPIMISWQVTKRIISIVSKSHHGGTMLFLSPEMRKEFCSRNKYLNIKYPFKAEEPRKRFRALLLKTMNTLAESCGDAKRPDCVVGWKEYVMSKNDVLRQLDEAVFEYAHFVAGLAAVDGAVILSGHELIGFGGMIAGHSDKVTVARALDSDGERTVLESTDGVGMRHRAVYHLCNELHDVIAMIISQDGDVEVVKWNNGIVTCWNVLPFPFY